MEMLAFGDVLGFPVEAGAVDSVSSLVEWKDRQGFTVEKGEYSDDTQLTLATARSISGGRFDPEYFAYVELPLWAYYQKGGGRSTLSAATNMFTVYIRWNNNFYPGYENAGGNGAAMRISPIVLSTLKSCSREMVLDVFKNTLITHGHPAAFVGSLTIASSLRHALMRKEKDLEGTVIFVKTVLEKTLEIVSGDDSISEWLSLYRGNFKEGFEKASAEMIEGLEIVGKMDDYRAFCERVGEFDHPGYAISSVLCAIFSFFRFDDPMDAMLKSANLKGTDTDTISSMVGALFGAVGYGVDDLEDVQDHGYIGRIQDSVLNGGEKREFERRETRIWAEEFQKLSKEGRIPDEHPVFGKMEVVGEEVSGRKKRLKVKTEEGQTVHFVVRVT